MRKPTLYKQRGKWQARFWNDTDKKYFSRSLGIPVEGKKERRAEAVEAARKIAADMEAAKNASAATQAQAEKQAIEAQAAATVRAKSMLLDYIFNFWSVESDYIKEKTLVEKNPPSKHYLYSNQKIVETKMRPFPDFQNITIGELTKPITRKWRTWLAEQGYNGDAINRALKCLRVPIKRAFADDIITTDPLLGIKNAKWEEKERGILTPEEIQRLIDTPITNPRNRLAVYLGIFCCLRIGEVRGLQWGDIIKAKGVLHITHNWQELEGMKKPKCNSYGDIPFPNIIADLFNEVYKIAPLTGDNDFVLSIKPYYPISREYLWQALRDELLSIGITDKEKKERNIVFHSLRHTGATLSLKIGLSTLDAMAITRHKQLKVFDRYIHAAEALEVKETVSRFNGFIEGTAIAPPILTDK